MSKRTVRNPAGNPKSRGTRVAPMMPKFLPAINDPNTPNFNRNRESGNPDLNTPITDNFQTNFKRPNPAEQYITQSDLIFGRFMSTGNFIDDCWEIRNITYLNYRLRHHWQEEKRLLPRELAAKVYRKERLDAVDIASMWMPIGRMQTTSVEQGKGSSKLALETRGSVRLNNIWSYGIIPGCNASRNPPKAGAFLYILVTKCLNSSDDKVSSDPSAKFVRYVPHSRAQRFKIEGIQQQEMKVLLDRKRARDDADKKEARKRRKAERAEREDELGVAADNETAAERSQVMDEMDELDDPGPNGCHWAFLPIVYSTNQPPIFESPDRALIYIGIVEKEHREGRFSPVATYKYVYPDYDFEIRGLPKFVDQLSQLTVQFHPKICEASAAWYLADREVRRYNREQVRQAIRRIEERQRQEEEEEVEESDSSTATASSARRTRRAADDGSGVSFGGNGGGDDDDDGNDDVSFGGAGN